MFGFSRSTVVAGFAGVVGLAGSAFAQPTVVNSVSCKGSGDRRIFFDGVSCIKENCEVTEVGLNDTLKTIEYEIKRQVEIHDDQLLVCTQGTMKTAPIDDYTPEISNGALDVRMVTTKQKSMSRLIDKIMQAIDDFFKSNEGPLLIAEDHYFLVCEKLRDRLKTRAGKGDYHVFLEAMLQKDSKKNVVGLTWDDQLVEYNKHKNNVKHPVSFDTFRENRWKAIIKKSAQSIREKQPKIVIVVGASHASNMTEFLNEIRFDSGAFREL